jgi:hypothetical protein
MNTSSSENKDKKGTKAVAAAAVPGVIQPTFLLRSEAIDVLKTKGGLRELEARRALDRIPRARVGGEFKKWHYKDVEKYAADVRAGTIARPEGDGDADDEEGDRS